MRRPKNTYDMFAYMTRESLPSLERLADLPPSLERLLHLCLESKITDLILSFQVPCGSMNTLFTSCIFCLWLVYRNLHTSVFVFRQFIDLICKWKYLSLYPLAINYILPHPSLSSLSWDPLCWYYLATALNLLSSLSPAKLVYYTGSYSFE